jgi:tetratricopeptide (TPR) repeat protein
VYWGFGDVLGKNRRYSESIPFLERSVKSFPNNPSVWEDASTGYLQRFFETKDVHFLNTGIDYLKRSISLDSKNARTYAQLTAAYSYFMQQDSAKKYLAITDKLDPKAVNPEVRKILAGK